MQAQQNQWHGYDLSGVANGYQQQQQQQYQVTHTISALPLHHTSIQRVTLVTPLGLAGKSRLERPAALLTTLFMISGRQCRRSPASRGDESPDKDAACTRRQKMLVSAQSPPACSPSFSHLLSPVSLSLSSLSSPSRFVASIRTWSKVSFLFPSWATYNY